MYVVIINEHLHYFGGTPECCGPMMRNTDSIIKKETFKHEYRVKLARSVHQHYQLLTELLLWVTKSFCPLLRERTCAL